ncbi:MAG: hypothetical protein M3P50_01500, partial [Actinomycetota bacterium]|nr:hypothetical protein [Actinomycetota bacterium]
PTATPTPVLTEKPATALVSPDAAKAPDADGDAVPDVDDLTPFVPAPLLGRTVVVAPSRGQVVVRPPGAKSFTPLDGATYVPTGSVVDTRKGTIRLSSATSATTTQTATFRGGLFEVRQAAGGKGMTDIVLRGGDFGACPRRGTASASAKRKPPKRRVWAQDDKGRFRTHGRNSVATARGTAWLTEDTCAGTRTKVTKDAVSVRPVRGGGKAKIVRAGQQLLVRPPARR